MAAGLVNYKKLAQLAPLLTITLMACSSDPLTPEEAARLQRVYAEMPQQSAVGVIKNLRYAGLYKGGLETNWSTPLAEAINEAHFELDYINEDYDLGTDAGAASFLMALSEVPIRQRFVDELSTPLPEFSRTIAAQQQASVDGGKCVIELGEFSRSGERLHVTLYSYGRSQAGLEVIWDGLVGGVFPRVIAVEFGDTSLPMNSSYEVKGSYLRANMFSTNGRWVTDAIKTATTIKFQGDDFGEVVLPAGDMYQVGPKLEECAANRL